MQEQENGYLFLHNKTDISLTNKKTNAPEHTSNQSIVVKNLNFYSKYTSIIALVSYNIKCKKNKRGIYFNNYNQEHKKKKGYKTLILDQCTCTQVDVTRSGHIFVD